MESFQPNNFQWNFNIFFLPKLLILAVSELILSLLLLGCHSCVEVCPIKFDFDDSSPKLVVCVLSLLIIV